MVFQEIEVIIDDKGRVQIHVRGISGNACLDLTAELEEILGYDLLKRDLTPDYYNKFNETSQTQVKNKN